MYIQHRQHYWHWLGRASSPTLCRIDIYWCELAARALAVSHSEFEKRCSTTRTIMYKKQYCLV
jgi:hypothetical protein